MAIDRVNAPYCHDKTPIFCCTGTILSQVIALEVLLLQEDQQWMASMIYPSLG